MIEDFKYFPLEIMSRRTKHKRHRICSPPLLLLFLGQKSEDRALSTFHRSLYAALFALGGTWQGFNCRHALSGWRMQPWDFLFCSSAAAMITLRTQRPPSAHRHMGSLITPTTWLKEFSRPGKKSAIKRLWIIESLCTNTSKSGHLLQTTKISFSGH